MSLFFHWILIIFGLGLCWFLKEIAKLLVDIKYDLRTLSRPLQPKSDGVS